jgi:YfiR/HmsC-like
MNRLSRGWLVLLTVVGGLAASPQATLAAELTEYQLKAAFLYNFAVFTEWPAEVGTTLNLCVLGPDPFGEEINELHGKAVGNRSLALQRKAVGDSVKACQIVFISAPAHRNIPRILDELRDKPVLTVAESLGAGRLGVALNMAVVQNKITFEASQAAARSARLTLSSKLLRLATEVHQ